MTFTYCIKEVSADQQIFIVDISFRLTEDLFRRNVWSPFVCIAFPERIHCIADFKERFVELFAGMFLECPVECPKSKRIAGCTTVCLSHYVRAVVQVPESSDRQISEGVVVGCVIFLGDESPFVPFPEIPVVESYPVVVEEICSTSSSRGGQCCFSYYGISFYVGKSWIQKRGKDVPHLSENEIQRSLGPCHAELHLGYMSGFVDREHCRPRHRLRVICTGNGEEVHSFWCPCYRSVCSVVCMHHYRHQSSVSLSGPVSCSS